MSPGSSACAGDMSGTPSISISEQHQRFSSLPRYPPLPATATAPMAVPGLHDVVPPPLPPPTYLPEISGCDPGWQWGNDPNGSDFGKPVAVHPGSSLLGGGSWSTSRAAKEHEYPAHTRGDLRRGSSTSTVIATRDANMAEAGSLTSGDEGGSLSGPPANYGLQGERPLEQRNLQASSHTYDKQLLSRIGGPNAVPNTPRTSISLGSGSHNSSSNSGNKCSNHVTLQESAQLAHVEAERRNAQLRPLSMPERRPQAPQQTSLDLSPAAASSARWAASGAISPRFTGFWTEHGPPLDNSRTAASGVVRHGSLTFDDSLAQQGVDEHCVFVHDDLVEDGPMSDLTLHDYQLHARTGTKRRASSPPRDQSRDERSSVSSASGQSEIYHRRSVQALPHRDSPVSRFHPSHSSLSSASSFGPRQNSLGSSLGIASVPSSATSYGSGRLSPSALSSAFEGELRMNGLKTLNSIPAPNSAHQRSMSESTQPSIPSTPAGSSTAHSRNGSIPHVRGVYTCECCPKKPKKFDSDEELRLHESEKQYTCAYCPNRFKNKNEAERHQNSLHLRRQSWSCATLANVKAAFHASSSGAGADMCGYCGQEFSNPPQWDVRAEHLNHVHKSGECNLTKKFFRADHFRQHLKHSHAGTSGKWTNMLESACMKEEPLPEKRVVLPLGCPPALMISTSAPIRAQLPQHGAGAIDQPS